MKNHKVVLFTGSHEKMYVKVATQITLESAPIYFTIDLRSGHTTEDINILSKMICADKHIVQYSFKPWFETLFVYEFASVKAFVNTYIYIATKLGYNLNFKVGDDRVIHEKVVYELYKTFDRINETTLADSVQMTSRLAEVVVSNMEDSLEDEEIFRVLENLNDSIHTQRAMYASRYIDKNQK